jgi:hypothetical protein
MEAHTEILATWEVEIGKTGSNPTWANRSQDSSQPIAGCSGLCLSSQTEREA